MNGIVDDFLAFPASATELFCGYWKQKVTKF